MMNIAPLTSLANGQSEAKSAVNMVDLLKSKQKAAAVTPVSTPIDKGQQSNGKRLDQATMSAASVQRYQAAYQYSNTMSMQLKTREGDEVTVDFRQMYAQYQEFNRQQMMEEGPQGVRYFESREAMESTAFEERFGISVKGDLNEQELAAIFDVFEQVDQLANTFFNGDFEKAFAQALELKVDYGQIASFSLNLTQTETRAVSYQQGAVAQYQQVQNPEQLEPGLGLKDLPPYLQSWQSVIEKLDEQFLQAQTIFEEMMAGVLAQRFPEQDDQQGWLGRMKNIHQEMAGLLDLNAAKVEEAQPSETLVNPEKIQSV